MSGLKIMLPVAAVILAIFGVLLAILFATGTGGNNGATPTPSSTVTEAIPASPTPLGADWKTVTPQPAASLGRSDCPQGWLAYVDPESRFSICYPPDSGVAASDVAVNVHSLLSAVIVAAGWNATPGTIYHPPSPENCPKDGSSVEGPATSTFTKVVLASGTVPAWSLGRQGGELHAAVPLASDGSGRLGYISWFVVGSTSTTGVPPIGRSIIQTLSVNFR